MEKMKAALFDLDGVIVDTAKYHYLAWKRLASELGFDFSEKDNERLKGVSRMRSLDILLEVGGMTLSPGEKEEMSRKKNDWYVEYIQKLDHSEILPGAREYLEKLRAQGILTALGSASKNAVMILDQLDITHLFDAIVDGNSVSRAKPDPEVFLTGARLLGVTASDCTVFEDAEAGIEAAKRAGMYAVGIGSPRQLPQADRVISSLADLV